MIYALVFLRYRKQARLGWTKGKVRYQADLIRLLIPRFRGRWNVEWMSYEDYS